MKKEEKIKEAYKKYFYETAVDHRMYISFNGWSDKLNLELIKDDEFLKELDILETTFRPKSLKGIENNNGWIKIESEDDLPKDFITCYIMTIYSDNTIVEAYYSDGERRFKPRDKYSTWIYSFDEITHYQPIEKPKPPIY